MFLLTHVTPSWKARRIVKFRNSDVSQLKITLWGYLTSSGGIERAKKKLEY